ncbi:MAG: FeoA family protein [Rhodospirillaceae bacterium]|nr:FeoA family protein [Rhodospirillaceae bacterium]
MTKSKMLPLDRLPHGLPARISKIGEGRIELNSAEPILEDLLLGLGFEEGAEIEIRHQGPLGGPLAVQVDGRLIALRPIDASAILVETEVSRQVSGMGA